MHNIDRVLSPQGSFDESEFEAADYGDEYDDTEFEFYDEANDGLEDDATLASELLSISSEEELEYFIGDLLKTAAKGAVKFAKSNAGRAVGSALKQAAKSALPTLGAALGSAIPIPGVGTAVGAAAGKALSSALEFESGLDVEDNEFEVAQNVVRLAKTAAKQAMKAPRGANPNAVASRAVKTALKKIQVSQNSTGTTKPQSGRWIRRGNKIILQGV